MELLIALIYQCLLAANLGKLLHSKMAVARDLPNYIFRVQILIEIFFYFFFTIITSQYTVLKIKKRFQWLQIIRSFTDTTLMKYSTTKLLLTLKDCMLLKIFIFCGDPTVLSQH